MKKSILITGASTGIGYAVAHGLHQKGWQVFASCRSDSDVLRLQGEGLNCVQLDVDDSKSIAAAFENVLAATNGSLDAVFCNAGYGQTGAVEDMSREALRAQYETNVFGTWECATQAMKVFRRQGRGRLLVNSSVLGFAAMPFRGAYNSSKFALEGICDTLRHEVHGSEIYVTLIEPGPIVSQFRPNALIKLKQYVDMENSFHYAAYQSQLARLGKKDAAAHFTLPPEACLDACLRALNASSPKARYQVTFPSKLFWVLRRLLPTKVFDWALRKGV